MACLNFTLYLDSSFPRSIWANDVRSLTKLCQQFAGTHYSIEILNIEEEHRRAFHEGVVTTPAILFETEGGRKQLLGNFAETTKFLKLLSKRELAAPYLAGPSKIAAAREIVMEISCGSAARLQTG